MMTTLMMDNNNVVDETKQQNEKNEFQIFVLFFR